MSTLSIPVSPHMLLAIEDLVRDGRASNKADLVRKAIENYLKEEAIRAILQAEKEPTLEGDLDELAKKF